ncbi:hypothetical protein PtB15_9B231 [Puccinia triticina]|nr:hypothetical protein PtB15_9B231 [Puccinia triticina]
MPLSPHRHWRLILLSRPQTPLAQEQQEHQAGDKETEWLVLVPDPDPARLPDLSPTGSAAPRPDLHDPSNPLALPTNDSTSLSLQALLSHHQLHHCEPSLTSSSLFAKFFKKILHPRKQSQNPQKQSQKVLHRLKLIPQPKN